jgi:hypothetical protein
MKNSILFLMLFIASYSFSQSINDYKAVIIPMKFEFQKSANQYRLQTKTKVNLQTAGITSFYAVESIPAEFNDRCSLLYVDVVDEKAFLATKLSIVFKDCSGKVVFQSSVGKSKEKEFDASYTEALFMAFKSVNELNYKYNGGNSNASSVSTNFTASSTLAVPAKSVVPLTSQAAASPVSNVPMNNDNASLDNNLSFLYAQPTSYGYQLIDSEPKVVMKIYKTSNPASFMAKKGDVQGALISKENQWFFEYYQNDKLVSEKIEVKF